MKFRASGGNDGDRFEGIDVVGSIRVMKVRFFGCRPFKVMKMNFFDKSTTKTRYLEMVQMVKNDEDRVGFRRETR